MFGLFGRSISRPVDARQLGIVFDEMAKQCPAGAYMFARGVGIGVLMLTAGQHPSWLRKRLLEDLADDSAKTFGIDKGSTLLAAQALLKIARAQTDGFKSFGVDDVIARIAAAGDRYRGLTKRDSVPPQDEFDRKFLDHVSCATLAEWVDTIRSQPAETPEDIRDEIDKSVACFDMFEEYRSKHLLEHLSKIDAWVKS